MKQTLTTGIPFKWSYLRFVHCPAQPRDLCCPTSSLFLKLNFFLELFHLHSANIFRWCIILAVTCHGNVQERHRHRGQSCHTSESAVQKDQYVTIAGGHLEMFAGTKQNVTMRERCVSVRPSDEDDRLHHHPCSWLRLCGVGGG